MIITYLRYILNIQLCYIIWILLCGMWYVSFPHFHIHTFKVHTSTYSHFVLLWNSIVELYNNYIFNYDIITVSWNIIEYMKFIWRLKCQIQVQIQKLRNCLGKGSKKTLEFSNTGLNPGSQEENWKIKINNLLFFTLMAPN